MRLCFLADKKSAIHLKSFSSISIDSVHKQRASEILAYLFVWTSTIVLKLMFFQYFLSSMFISKYLDCDPSEELIKSLAIFAIHILQVWVWHFTDHTSTLYFSFWCIKINFVSFFWHMIKYTKQLLLFFSVLISINYSSS